MIGPIFLHLRAKMLSFYPEGVKNVVADAPTFSSWIESGGFNVRSATSSGFVIECSPVEVASVFLRDVEKLLNHCVEHTVEIHNFGLDQKLRSDAWNVVTIYYQCFFAAQALLRLVGEPVFFIDKDNIRRFKAVSTSLVFPGAGMFEFSQTGVPTLSTCEYSLDKKTLRPHEATWKYLFQLFDRLIKDSTLATDAKEVSLFACLATQKLFKIYTDYDWPSRIRYNANYNPGFAYLLVEGLNKTRTKNLSLRWQRLEESQVEPLLRSSVDSCVCSTEFECFETHVRLLHDLGQALLIITKNLYNELLIRRSCDKRWSLRCRKLLQRAGISPQEYALLLK